MVCLRFEPGAARYVGTDKTTELWQPTLIKGKFEKNLLKHFQNLTKWDEKSDEINCGKTPKKHDPSEPKCWAETSWCRRFRIRFFHLISGRINFRLISFSLPQILHFYKKIAPKLTAHFRKIKVSMLKKKSLDVNVNRVHWQLRLNWQQLFPPCNSSIEIILCVG